MTSPRFPEPPQAVPPTPLREVDRHLERLDARKDAWVRLEIPERIALLEAAAVELRREAAGWTQALSAMKGIATDDPLHGEDWLGGPLTLARNIRLLVEALKAGGQPRPAGLRQRPDGQWVADVFPATLGERLLYLGWRAEVWIEPGKPPSQGRIYREKSTQGAVALVLGAGNVASIAPMDVLYKLFVENQVCILKMNPVNEVGGPFIERIFAKLVEAGFLSVVYGGADVGKHLAEHPQVHSIHITGSDRTHDAIVWGSTPAEQARNKAAGTPRNPRPITSELGCVTPVIVVPGPWSARDLEFQARHVAGMVVQNGSFNCNAAKVLVTARGWPLRERFLKLVDKALAEVPPRKAYYPGAQERYVNFVSQYPDARVLGKQGEQVVPWTLLPEVPPAKGEYALSNEAFCGVLAETTLEATTATEFVAKALPFVNEEVWGTLSCMVLIHPASRRELGAGFDALVAGLRYGGIAINGWAGAVYGLCHTSWGAFPGHRLEDIQSGRGVVHNTLLFDHPQKSVVHMPFRMFPAPPWFPAQGHLAALAQELTGFEAEPSLLKIPAIAARALRS